MILPDKLYGDGVKVPLVGAVSISNPWDLLIGDRFYTRGRMQKFYNRVLGDSLKGAAKLRQEAYARLSDWEGIEKSRSIRDFNNYSARIAGNFETIDAFHRWASCARLVTNVSVPLFCLNAIDDPVCTDEAIPWDEIRIGSGIGRLQRFYSGVSRESAAAEDVITEMLRRKPMPSIVDFNNEIVELSRKGHYLKATESFRKMNMAGVKMSEHTISIVTNCFGKLKLMDQGLSLLGHSIKSGLEIDDHVIASIVDGLMFENRVDDAISFFKKILMFGNRHPSTVLYNILLKGSCQAHDYKRAIQIFDTMDFEHDIISYSILISHLLDRKEFQEAVSLLNRMLCDTRVVPDSALFGSVMKSLLDSNYLQDARMILPLMVQQNTYFQANFFNVVVGYFCQRGMVKHAEGVVQFMLKRCITPTVITFNTLLLGYCLSKKLHSAERLYQLMIRGSLNVSADIVSATTLLKCYCSNPSSLEKGLKFFEKTFGKKTMVFAPNAVTYATIIQALFKAKNPDLASEYLHEMKSRDIHASQKLYGVALNGFVTNGDLESANSYFNEPENDVFNNNVVVWNIMIKGAIINGRFVLAKAYMDGMIKRGIKPDLKSFTPMLIAFYAHNFTIEADNLVSEMRKIGIPLWLVCNELKVAYEKSWLAVEKKRLWIAMKKLETEAMS
ncbi:AB hydrolase 4 family [Artemisia annua]|uniref:AB hydrolase 4 family n=1 Tax=Artemisia annua TaxID=35608 RepID=A0A2U1PBC1_ARTAN|nr:AB hydrolase 4 family [Artemisia annua]